jgi:uncharacterized protein YndB with AHSA1/START domain
MNPTFHFPDEKTDASIQERAVTGEITVNANIYEVWKAWTTNEGVRTFFAPDSRVDLRVNGRYEIFFLNDSEEGKKGSENCFVLALQDNKMLTFSWSAPPELPEAREQRTVVIVRFSEVDELHTKINITHVGWGEGGEWDEAYNYFKRAWTKVVLPRLKYRFDVGPIDWSNPPTFN